MFRFFALFVLLLLPFNAYSEQKGSDAATNSPALLPFGSNLFQGNFAGAASSNSIQAGDRFLVQIQGAYNVDNVFIVASGSMLEIPGLGSIPLEGLARDASEPIRLAILRKLAVSGFGDCTVAVRPLDTQGISLFVTGFVNKPGNYSGTSSDTLLSFLDKAGGIDSQRGSYRDIQVIRNGKVIEHVDLYPFILNGFMPQTRLRQGDTIVVTEKGISVAASGEIRNAARFEFQDKALTGGDLMKLADPSPRATHAGITGFRNGSPYHQYVSLKDFGTLSIESGDRILFTADTAGRTIMVEAQGAIIGASRFPIKRSAHLKEVLNYISIDPERANLAGLYIKRKSTAKQQKKAIEDALRRLEHNAYTATSSSNDEAQIRAKEAEMLSNFIQRARAAEPEGVVVVGYKGGISDIALEEDDIIVIPEKTDVVLINGEVIMPQAVVWNQDRSMDDYIQSAGGFGNRADTHNILVLHPNGEVSPKAKKVLPGDQILVLPRVDSKNLQAVKQISEVLYQVAIACKVILEL